MENKINPIDQIKSKFKPYIHQAKYYDTDQMAVVHHSNYIRWFEEARVDFLDQVGLSFQSIEEAGMYCPVLGVSCEYKSSVRFHEDVIILTKITSFNGFLMTISYQVVDADTKKLRSTGESKHCFVTKDFKPVNLKKSHKDMYNILLPLVGVEFGW